MIENLFSTSTRDKSIRAVRFYSKNLHRTKIIFILSRIINRYIYRFGIGSVVNRYDSSLTIYSSLEDKKLYQDYPHGSIFCNFGSGAFFHKFWKNYDFPGQSKLYKTIQGKLGRDFFSVDLSDDKLKISEDDSSVSLIYCSHTLEHVNEKSGKRFLNECFRILLPDGVLRISLPTLGNEIYIMSLLNKQKLSNKFKKNLAKSLAKRVLSDASEQFSADTNLELFIEANFNAAKYYRLAQEKGVDISFRPENPERHISFWDLQKIINISQKIGFKFTIPTLENISLSDPFKNSHVFDNTETQQSFYIELVK